MSIINKNFRVIILLIFLAELVSFLAYFFPFINELAFFILVTLCLILSLKRLEYGSWLVLTELFISSKGYLFFFEYEGITISLRIALWLIIISVWLGKTLSNWFKTKRLEVEFLNSSYFPYFLIFFIFIIWGLLNGFLNHNSFPNIFFDFNSWLYFSLIFPLFSIISNDKGINSIWQIFISAMVWLSIKTLFLLFVFSHNIIGLVYELYRWVALTGVGEITLIQGGFYRIFFQSHIFILISFYILLIILENRLIKVLWKQNIKIIIYNFILLTFFNSIIFISFSRSYWIGYVLAMVFLWFIYIIKIKVKLKKIILLNLIWLCSLILALGFTVTIVNFPYPKPVGGFETTGLLSQRVSQLSSEAGASSRWSLLPELWAGIKKSIFFGKGFGTTITYKSSDPRITRSNPAGYYTTYAFEWGWLDIWLKVGLFGLIYYLIFIFKICYDGVSLYKKTNINFGLAIGLVIITTVSIFSPYINHPLGIGYIILCSLVFDYYKKSNKSILNTNIS